MFIKKITLLLIVLNIASFSSFAQLSTRQNDSTAILFGSRPKKGTGALSFSVHLLRDTINGIAPLNVGNSLRKGELLTYRYYLTDDLVLRTGLRLTKDSRKAEGYLADSTKVLNPTNPSAPGWIESIKAKGYTREYILVPGIEKHFSRNSIFDVYVGADLYMGFGKDYFNRSIVYTNDDYYKIETKTRNSIFGLGGVTGFNVFIAHLPISLGLEYGLNARWNWMGKTKVKESVQTTTGTTIETEEIEYVVLTDDPAGLNPKGTPYKYSDGKSRYFTMDTNQNIRLILNIYF